MTFTKHALALACAIAALPAFAAVSADEAAALKTTLTPLGAERAGNKDGTIPSWDGGMTKATPGFVNGGRRPDPFAGEKPLFSVSSKNMAQYADKLSEGTRALMTKYPDFRIDVYKTNRSFAAPQYIYDRTAKNATTAKLVDGISGVIPSGWIGGYPFPVPKSGEEAMFNHLLRWTGTGQLVDSKIYMVTAQGKPVLQAQNIVEVLYPYNLPTPVAKDDGAYTRARFATIAPALTKGQAVTNLDSIDPDKSVTHIYLTGQRRVKMIPNACCDTPAPGTGGVLNFDEINTFNGSLKQYNWKIVGKQEMFIPYNTNRSLVPTSDADLVSGHFVNPDHVRWELHRVWVVEANLKPGKRHINPKSRYYLDEDSWFAVLGDRWDAQGQLVKTNWSLPIVTPDQPGMLNNYAGAYDLITGQWFATNVCNDAKTQFQVKDNFPEGYFSPDTLAGEGVR